MKTAAEPSPLSLAQDELAAAAEAHIAHRRGCGQLGCAECASLARLVLRWQHQIGFMRFARLDDDEVA